MTAQTAYFRSEVEVAANTVVALKTAGMLAAGVTLERLCDATGLTADDLRSALVRSDRVPARRLAPQPALARAVEPAALSSLPQRVSHPKLPVPPVVRLVPRARQQCAERIFAMWRARGNLTCSRCGKPIDSGCDAVIESAHHADKCPDWGTDSPRRERNMPA